MANIKLRDYQLEACRKVEQVYGAGVGKQLVVLPTGTGKTILMPAIAKVFNKKTLVITNNDELVHQTKDKFRLMWPDVSIGICKAKQNEITAQVVIATIQTISRDGRLEQLKEQGSEVLLIDEAHHATAGTYKKVIAALGFDIGKKLMVGFTATPDRHDGSSLLDVFTKQTFSRSIGTMIREGYLTPVYGRKILTTASLDNVKTHMGDFMTGQLSRAVNTNERNSFIVQKYQRYAPHRKAICFAVDVQHIKDLVEAFIANGVKSAGIWGAMPHKERKGVLKDFSEGSIQVVVSCGVLTEGFDEPSISCIIMARPTQSLGLYKQCVGRGLRLFPGKQDCLVLDFTDNGHNLNNTMSLKKAIPEADVFPDIDGQQDREDKLLPINERLREICDKEFDILGQKRFMWASIGDGEYSLLDGSDKEIVMRPHQDGYVAHLYHKNSHPISIVADPLPLDYCQGACEDYARDNLVMNYADINGDYLGVASKREPTPKQIDFLRYHKVKYRSLNRAEATLKIREIIAIKNKERRSDIITPAQKIYLDGMGVKTDGLSKREAMQLIGTLKQAQDNTNQNNYLTR